MSLKTNPIQLLSLPDEIILLIIQRLTLVSDLLSIARSCKKLRLLYNDHISNSGRSVLSFSSSSNLGISSAFRHKPPRIKRETLIRFLSTHKQLRQLDLSNKHLDSPFIMKCTDLRHLSILNLSDCLLNQTHAWFYILKQMRNLKELDLSRCFSITHTALRTFLNDNKPPKLVKVILNDLHVPRACLRLLQDANGRFNIGAASLSIGNTSQELNLDPVDIYLLEHEIDMSGFVELENSNLANSENSFPLSQLLTLQRIRYLHHLGMSLDAFLANGTETVLSAATEHGRADVVQYLLESGANPNLVNPNSSKPPILAWAKSGNTKVLKLLIQHGADIHQADIHGHNVLQRVVTTAPLLKRVEMIEQLLQCGCDINYVSPFKKSCKSALDLAFLAMELESSTLQTTDYDSEKPKDNLAICSKVIQTLLNNDAVMRQPLDYLKVCIQVNDIHLARFLFSKGLSIFGEDKFFLDTLSTISESMFLELLRHGANPSATTWNGMSTLSQAASKGYDEVVRYLISLGADPNEEVKKVSWETHSPLKTACVNGQFETVKVLTENGAKMKPEYIKILLNLGFDFGPQVDLFLSILQKSIINGFDLSQPIDDDHNTLLHSAIKLGFDSKLTKFLIQNTDLKRLNRHGDSPLHILAHESNGILSNDIQESLIKMSPVSVYNFLNAGGFAPLHIACLQKKIHFVKSLLDSGADPNILTKDQITPLHIATAEEGAEVLINLILDHKANPEIPNCNGETPIHIAIRHNNFGCFQNRNILKKPNHMDNLQRSVLHYLARSKDINCVKKFIFRFRSSLNFAAKDAKGCFPHEIADVNEIRLALKKEFDEYIKRNPRDVAAARSDRDLLDTFENPLEALAYFSETPSILSSFDYLVRKFGIKWKTKEGDYLFESLLSPSSFIHTSRKNFQLAKILISCMTKEIMTSHNRHGYFPIHLIVQSNNAYLLSLAINRFSKNLKVSTINEGYSPMHVLIKDVGVETVMIVLLMLAGIYPNEIDFSGKTFLHWIALERYDSESISRWCQLESHPSHPSFPSLPDINIKDNDGKTALHYLIEKGQPLELEKFLQTFGKSIDFTILDGRDKTYIQGCEDIDKKKLLKKYKKLNSSPFDKDCLEETELYETYTRYVKGEINGHFDIEEYLANLQRRQLIAVDNTGNTLLHLACEKKEVLWIQGLVNHNSSLTVLNQIEGMNPLQLYIQRHGISISLIQLFAMKDKTWYSRQNVDGKTTLYMIAEHAISQSALLAILNDICLSCPVDFNAKNGDNSTILHLICTKDQFFPLVKFIFNHNGEMNIQDKNKICPFFEITKKRGLSLMTKELRKQFFMNGFDVNMTDGSGKTLFHLAMLVMRNDQIFLSEWLDDLDVIPDFSIQDSEGNTVLHYMVQTRNQSYVVNFLSNYHSYLDVHSTNKEGQKASHYAVSNESLFNKIKKYEDGLENKKKTKTNKHRGYATKEAKFQGKKSKSNHDLNTSPNSSYCFSGSPNSYTKPQNNSSARLDCSTPGTLHHSKDNALEDGSKNKTNQLSLGLKWNRMYQEATG